MTQFYIVEVRQLQNGEYEHYVHYAYDESADKAQRKAESKYYEVLAAAAVSNTLSHSAILFSTEGFPLMHQCYKHAVQPEPTPTPETETEGA